MVTRSNRNPARDLKALRRELEDSVLPLARKLGVVAPTYQLQEKIPVDVEAKFGVLMAYEQGRLDDFAPMDKATLLFAAVLVRMEMAGGDHGGQGLDNRAPEERQAEALELLAHMMRFAEGYLQALFDTRATATKAATEGQHRRGEATRARVIKEARALKGPISKEAAAVMIAARRKMSTSWIDKRLREEFPGNSWTERLSDDPDN